MKNITLVLCSLFLSLVSHANEENMPLLDIEPASELKLDLKFPKVVYEQSSTVVFQNGVAKAGSTFNTYNLGEYCEISFKGDPGSWFSGNISIERTVKIKHVNEAWTHSPGASMSEFGNNYRTGNNIWLEDESIQRISCYFIQDASEPLSEQEIVEIARVAKGKDPKEIPFLVEENLHYRLSLNHLKRHLGLGVVALNEVKLKDLDYWDQQTRKTIVSLRKEIKAKGRKQFTKEQDEIVRLGIAVGKLMKIEGAYRRSNGIGYDEPLDGNQNYQKYLKEEMENEKFPEDIKGLVNDSLKRQP